MKKSSRIFLFSFVVLTSAFILSKKFYHPQRKIKVILNNNIKHPRLEPDRKPSSLAPSKKQPSPSALKQGKQLQMKRYKGKKLVYDGKHPPSQEKLDQMIELNKVPKNWRERFEKSVLKFQSSETIAHVEIVEQLIRVEKEGLRNVNQVIVRLKNKDGLTSNYSGLMDPASSEMIKVWNRTHYEVSPLKKLKLPAKAL
jgi:hypothetical protein